MSAHTNQQHVLLSETPDFDMWVLVVAAHVLQPARLFPPRLAARSDRPPEARILDDHAATELRAVAAGRATDDPVLLRTGLRWWTARAWFTWQNAATTSSRTIHPAVARAAELLRSDPETPLVTLARRAGLSLSRLSRVFLTDIGFGLAEFRTERRLERVDAIMAASNPPPLLTAALDCGFGSYSQFYRAFTSTRGVTPREYYAVQPATRSARRHNQLGS
jgi:AraC-like DNA-binding protein